jgi:purine-binding chemotaxis protein CheW
MHDEASTGRLAVRAGEWTCLLEVRFVLETMRPLPMTAVEGRGPAVRGVTVVRGRPIPVVDLEVLLGGKSTTEPGRLVAVSAMGRVMGLLVTDIIGIRGASTDEGDAAPPLLPALENVTERLGVADGALFAVLAATRVIEEHGS